MQTDLRTIVALASFVLLAAILGFGGTYLIMDRSSQAPFARFEADAQNSFQANIKALVQMRAYLSGQLSSTGSYPISPSMQLVSAGLGKQFGDAGVGLFGGVYLYWSDNGKEYKLLANGTADCFVARRLAPDMVDPARSWGPVDCLAYGFWTPGAKAK